MLHRSALILALFLCVSNVAEAGGPFGLEGRSAPSLVSGPDGGRWEGLFENDSAMGFPLSPAGRTWDRWFTNGTVIRGRFPVAVDRPGVARAYLAGTLAQDIYTPRSVEVATIAELNGDRPYGGWLAGTFGGDAVLEAEPLTLVRRGNPWTHVGFELSAGAMGPWSGAGFVQYHAHFEYLRLEGKPMPPRVGWGVAETKPTLTVDASAFAETSLVALEGEEVPTLAFSGGRLALHVLGGARLDAGGFLDDAALTTTVLGGWMGDGLGRRDGGTFPLLVYLFAHGEVKAVAWNGTIDANVLDGTRAARSAPIVAEVSTGGVLRVWHLEGRVALAYRTNEVATLAMGRQSGQAIWQFQGAWIF